VLKYYSDRIRKAQDAIKGEEYQLAFDILYDIRAEINRDAKQVKDHRHWCEGCGSGLGYVKEQCQCYTAKPPILG